MIFLRRLSIGLLMRTRYGRSSQVVLSDRCPYRHSRNARCRSELAGQARVAAASMLGWSRRRSKRQPGLSPRMTRPRPIRRGFALPSHFGAWRLHALCPLTSGRWDLISSNCVVRLLTHRRHRRAKSGSAVRRRCTALSFLRQRRAVFQSQKPAITISAAALALLLRVEAARQRNSRC
jgi:hypothetical protein